MGSNPGRRGQEILFTKASILAVGDHPGSCSIVTFGIFSGTKRPWREAEHSPTLLADVKNSCTNTSNSPDVPMGDTGINLHLLTNLFFFGSVLHFLGAKTN